MDTLIYQLKVTLDESKPPIWRRVEVDGDLTLSQLHAVIQRAMGWADYHLHQFEVGGHRYGVPDPDYGDMEMLDERRYSLRRIVPDEGVKFHYEYDFGDSWLHLIEVERIGEPEPDVFYPRCIKGKRACPPEDCGGIWGYEELIATLQNPKHPDHKAMKQWVGGDLDPERFDLDEINGALASLECSRLYGSTRAADYTPTQGQYLAFIYYYTKLNRLPPAHVDFQKYFQVTPPSVNNMLKTLEQRGFIRRIAGQARSIRLLLPRERLPDLD